MAPATSEGGHTGLCENRFSASLPHERSTGALVLPLSAGRDSGLGWTSHALTPGCRVGALRAPDRIRTDGPPLDRRML